MIDDEQYLADQPWVVDAATRLDGVLRTYPWDEDSGIALGQILYAYTIEFADGFVLNPVTASGLGYSDVAMIVSRVCTSPRRSWHAWRNLILHGGTSSSYPSVYDNVLAVLQASDKVRSLQG